VHLQLFESLLIDCDTAVNFANWNYFAGIGTDPRNRTFKTVTQGELYDGDALLAQAWLPELCNLPVHLRHRPWLASPDDADKRMAGRSCGLGAAYPEPLVPIESQIGAGPRAAGVTQRDAALKANTMQSREKGETGKERDGLPVNPKNCV
jgi:deoxyribodipyrimidine photolyase